MTFKSKLFLIATGLMTFSNAGANAALDSFVNQKLKKLLASDLVISSIKSQNSTNENLSQRDIDTLDQKWRAEIQGDSGNLINSTLENDLSGYLSEVLEDSEGLYTEIFVMDNKGLNVGQSGLTSDYWQGDESKWQKTFLVGANAVHASDIEFDESSQTYQLQISVAITDPANNQVIGAATFGVNAEALEGLSLGDGY